MIDYTAIGTSAAMILGSFWMTWKKITRVDKKADSAHTRMNAVGVPSTAQANEILNPAPVADPNHHARAIRPLSTRKEERK